MVLHSLTDFPDFFPFSPEKKSEKPLPWIPAREVEILSVPTRVPFPPDWRIFLGSFRAWPLLQTDKDPSYCKSPPPSFPPPNFLIITPPPLRENSFFEYSFSSSGSFVNIYYPNTPSPPLIDTGPPFVDFPPPLNSLLNYRRSSLPI